MSSKLMMDITTFREILKTGQPEHLYTLLQTRFERDSRQAQQGHVRVRAIPKTEKFRRSFMFRAAALWNGLPNEFKMLEKKPFHDTLKRFLLGDFNGPGPPGPPPLPRSESTPITYPGLNHDLSFLF